MSNTTELSDRTRWTRELERYACIVANLKSKALHETLSLGETDALATAERHVRDFSAALASLETGTPVPPAAETTPTACIYCGEVGCPCVTPEEAEKAWTPVPAAPAPKPTSPRWRVTMAWRKRKPLVVVVEGTTEMCAGVEALGFAWEAWGDRAMDSDGARITKTERVADDTPLTEFDA